MHDFMRDAVIVMEHVVQLDELLLVSDIVNDTILAFPSWF